MLVLSRVVGELISIGDNITVRILSVNGSNVRFGVAAPKNVAVHRAAVYERIIARQGAQRTQGQG